MKNIFLIAFIVIACATAPVFAMADEGYKLHGEPAISFTAAAPVYVPPPVAPPTYIDPGAQTYCRPYSQLINLNNHAYEAYGTACLQPDGSWRTAR